MNRYTFSTKLGEMDIDLIHTVLSKSYWAQGIPRDVVSSSVANSLCFGVFASSGEQVAFARAVTDSATFAYIADVFVVDEHKGRGLGKWLTKQVMEHPQLQGLRRMVLATCDAHGLYEQFGFTPLAKPDTFMELSKPDVYQDHS